jgi:type IV pilus assembly protein PilN
MIRVNLLPHREIKRKERRQVFYVLCGISVAIGAAIVGLVALFINGEISSQNDSNAYIKGENAKLDDDIKEIVSLRTQIESLKARQKAVEDLQGDRNLPVHVLDELVKNTPEGIYLRSLKQQGARITLNGLAANNAKVADYVRNLTNNSPWLTSPELQEIRATVVGTGATAKRLNDFTMAVSIRRPKEPDTSIPPAAAPGVPKA